MRNLLFLTVALASGVLPLGVLGSPARVASWLESASNPSGAERAGIRIRTFFQPHQNCSAAVCFCERAGQAMVSFDDKTSTERPCTEEEILTPAKREFAEEHVQMAVDWLADALLVSPVKASLPVVVDTCGIVASRGAVVPSDHHNPGVPDADFVLYVTFVPDVGASQAWALACQEDQSGRPTAGLVNFAPTRIDPDSRGTTTAHNWMLTVVHELMHALGFADHRFEDAGWFPESPIPSGAASEKDADGITRIKTPNVVAKAREHFNCSDIDGVALENQGGTGTALSHWEKRILGNEIMTGVVTNEAAVVSAMTLAYFEDTGVYGVNYSTAGNLLYGKNRGCGFLTKACDALVADDGVTEFCFSRDSLQPTDTGCSFSGLGYGPCNVVTYGEDLPEAWQYYPGNPRVGGGLALPDYCPFVVPVVMCREQGSAVAATCKTQAAAEACGAVVGCVWDGAACLGAKEDVQGEGFSANSRCFFGSTVRNGWTASSSKARCLSVVCHAGGDGYTVTVDGHSLSCTAEQAGSPATASDPAAFTASWSGAVTCQPVALICDGSIATAPPTPAPPPETGSPPVAPVALSAAADEEDPMSPVLMLAIAGGAAFIAVCIAAVGYAMRKKKPDTGTSRGGKKTHRAEKKLPFLPPSALPSDGSQTGSYKNTTTTALSTSNISSHNASKGTASPRADLSGYRFPEDNESFVSEGTSALNTSMRSCGRVYPIRAMPPRRTDRTTKSNRANNKTINDSKKMVKPAPGSRTPSPNTISDFEVSMPTLPDASYRPNVGITGQARGLGTPRGGLASSGRSDSPPSNTATPLQRAFQGSPTGLRPHGHAQPLSPPDQFTF